MNGNDELNENELQGVMGGYPGSQAEREEFIKKQAEYIQSLKGELTEEQLSKIANNMSEEELKRVLGGGGKSR